jgi:hypothetical protein
MTVRLWYEINQDTMFLTLWGEDERNRYFVSGADKVVVEKGAQVPDSVRHSVPERLMQELLDALINAGYRPSSNAWAAGHVSDLKKHIDFAEHMAKSLLEKKDHG